MPNRDPSDAWFVRLPDGQVLRAKSTASVRRHIDTGRIPVDSLVRRSGEDDWITLDWAVEFADLASQKRKRPEIADGPEQRKVEPGLAVKETPLPSQDLRVVGVRGLVEQLLNALDNTISRRKLMLAGLACLLGSGVGAFPGLLDALDVELPWPWLSWAAAGLVLLFISGVAAALLTQMTVVELSRLRLPLWNEALAGLLPLSLRVMACQGLVAGSVLLATAGLRALPGWILLEATPGQSNWLLAANATVFGLILQVLLWPILGLTLLLAPIVIVEEGSIGTTIAQWWSLIRRHLSRVFLYEALAAALGAVMTIPFLFPVVLAGWLSPFPPGLAEVQRCTLILLGGAAMTPLVAYLLVANVFIYLNLRYELSTAPR